MTARDDVDVSRPAPADERGLSRLLRRRLEGPSYLLTLVLLTSGLLGCGTTAPSAPVGLAPRSAPAFPDLQERALLLLIEDRRLWEPITIESALKAGTDTREALAWALGRIGDRRGEDVLLELLRDPQSTVRRAAAFSLARFDTAPARDALMVAVTDPDRGTGIEAVRALARQGRTLAELSAALSEMPAEELWFRLVPSLFHLSFEERRAAAELALSEAPPELHRSAALAITFQPRSGVLPTLRSLVEVEDHWVRGSAAEALGRVGERADRERLGGLLGDPSSFVRSMSIVGLGLLLARGVTAPPSNLEALLIDALDDSSAGVRRAALGTLGRWSQTEAVTRALEERFADTGAPVVERCAALDSLATLGHVRARDLAAVGSTAEEESLRACSVAAVLAGAQGWIGADVEELFLGDPSSRVRASFFRSLANTERFGSIAELGLQDETPVVRSVLYELLEKRPVLTLEQLLRKTFEGKIDARDLQKIERAEEIRAGLLRAVAARGRAQRLERGAAILLLEAAAQEDPSRLVRLEAALRLHGLGQETPAVSGLSSRAGVSAYREAVQRTIGLRHLLVETHHGNLRIEIECERIPLNCLSLQQLAGQGFFDGQELYAGEPGVELRGGDPQALGHGGPGYTLRDEVIPLRFDRPGIFGMGRRFTDGVGSRFFITLSPQPWRTGKEVALGRVVSGLEVLDRLQVSDRILRVTVEP